MRRNRLLWGSLCALGVGAALAARPPVVSSPRLRDLLARYPVEKTLTTMGSSANPHGGWHPQTHRSYVGRSREALELRLQADLPRLGLTRALGPSGAEWRTPDAAFRLRLTGKNPNFWLPDGPKGCVYVETWEPRAQPLGERIDDAWLELTRRFWPKGRPAFYPVPVRSVASSAKEP